MHTAHDAADLSYPPLPSTSWAVLGMLTFGEELTGNDLKKWVDWSIGLFYWSPSVSQVYGELKKLETLGLATSRLVSEPGLRGRRLFAVTPAGVDAARAWSRGAKVDIPILKHGVMLRLWMGHLSDPEHLEALIRGHIENMRELRERAAINAEFANREPSWAYPRMSLRWAMRYFDAEISLAEQLFDDLREAAQWYAQSPRQEQSGLPKPTEQGIWKSVEALVDDLRRHGEL